MSKADILIVDDQPSICREVVTFLKDAYTVHAFSSGAEALDYLSANHVDLALLDYEMPNMTGYELLMEMQKNGVTKKIPVVFLTGETNDRMKREMLSRGAKDYLCKPINSAELHHSIEKHLP